MQGTHNLGLVCENAKWGEGRGAAGCSSRSARGRVQDASEEVAGVDGSVRGLAEQAGHVPRAGVVQPVRLRAAAWRAAPGPEDQAR